MNKRYPLVGAHISISDQSVSDGLNKAGLSKAVEKAESIGCTAMQIFTKSNRTWFAKKISTTESNLFKNALKKSNISEVIVHAAYLINLAAKDTAVKNKSLKSLKEEMKRCEQLGIKYLVLHPGAHVGEGEEEGIIKIAKNLDSVMESTTTTILLETTAGQGTNIGYTFEQIKKIRTLCRHKRRIHVCLDTCHIFAAGYDIRTEKTYKETLKAFDKIIGLKNLKAIHLNSSKTGLGSKKDRHENIGKGTIPLLTFKLIMNDSRLKNIPKILETPTKTLSSYEHEIKLLKKL